MSLMPKSAGDRLRTKAAAYQRRMSWLRSRPRLLKALLFANKVFTCIGYIAYPALLILVFLFERPLFVKVLLVPAIGFVLVTALRRLIDEPRPYEALGIQPLIPKDTKGLSFPSRHVFSMAMIALSWLYWSIPVGVLLLVSTAAMAYVRVLGGVHYTHDVVAGAGIAILFACVGFWLL